MAGRDNRKLNDKVLRHSGGSQTARDNRNPRRRLHGAFVIPNKSQVRARTRARFPASLAHYACKRFSPDVVIESANVRGQTPVRVSLEIRPRVLKLLARTSTSLELSRAGFGEGHLACAI